MSFSLFLSWRSQSDLLAGLEALRHLSRACQSSFAPAAKQAMLGDVVYGGYVTNGLDLHAVESLAKFVPSEQMKVVITILLTFFLIKCSLSFISLILLLFVWRFWFRLFVYLIWFMLISAMKKVAWFCFVFFSSFFFHFFFFFFSFLSFFPTFSCMIFGRVEHVFFTLLWFAFSYFYVHSVL